MYFCGGYKIVMMLNKLRFLVVVLLMGSLMVSCSKKAERFELPEENLVEYVNPMVGTAEHGHTFPGAVMPFGMVQLSPDTRLDGWDGCSGYHYTDSEIYGFTHTHLSGTGCSDYGDVLLMPMCGKFSTDNKEYSSHFSHDTEVAEPGYYAVKLSDDDIDVELTVSPRVGMHRYKFNREGKRYIVLDLEHRDVVLEAGLRKHSDNCYTGVRRSHAWADNQHLYFAMQFSTDVSIVEPADFDWESDSLCRPDKPVYVFEIADSAVKEVLVKVAISQVDEDGALKNMEQEVPNWDFDALRKDASDAWNHELNKIIVKGGSEEQRKVFYTAMYHSFVHPTLAQDVDRRYRGTDLQVHSSDDFTAYTVFSLWDTYRAAHPLYTITQQARSVDFIKTFIAEYSQGGRLPMWELSSNYTGCMIGYHAVPPMVDAYFKGIKFKNLESLALEAMVASATADELGKRDFARHGFMSVNEEHESVSKNLEYGFDDWCIAQFAKSQGDKEKYREYMIRSQAYKHIFDKSCGFMCPRQNGSWKENFDPKEIDFNFTEANSWQYTFYVPHDILGFIELMGGNEAFEAKLDELFSTGSETHGKDLKDITGLIGQYVHGNEPSHHIAYMYNYCGKPTKTQKIVRQIMSEMYNTTPAGSCGNEDCGQMSAWYVLSAMGFYPINPANGVYDIGSPIFDTVQINLENGKKCLIVTHDNSPENIYVGKMEINGKPYTKSYILHSDIADGARIDFYMTADPQNGFGTNSTDIYPSRIEEFKVVPAPYAKTGVRTFHDSLKIELACSDDSAKIYYSVGNGEEKLYSEPLILNETTKLTIHSERDGYVSSKPVEAKYIKIDADRRIKLHSKYNPMYTAGGDDALVDHLRGGNDFRTGEWQGYHGQDFEAVVDLCEVKDIKSIETGFIQDVKSWILFPKYVEYYTSNDGVNFKKIATVNHNVADNDYRQQIYNFRCEPANCKARYVKVFAKYYGTLPKWHLGAGGETHLFIDEIEIVEK